MSDLPLLSNNQHSGPMGLLDFLNGREIVLDACGGECGMVLSHRGGDQVSLVHPNGAVAHPHRFRVEVRGDRLLLRSAADGRVLSHSHRCLGMRVIDGVAGAGEEWSVECHGDGKVAFHACGDGERWYVRDANGGYETAAGGYGLHQYVGHQVMLEGCGGERGMFLTNVRGSASMACGGGSPSLAFRVDPCGEDRVYLRSVADGKLLSHAHRRIGMLNNMGGGEEWRIQFQGETVAIEALGGERGMYLGHAHRNLQLASGIGGDGERWFLRFC